MSNTPVHSVSVAGVVLDDWNRVLVIQRRDNERWEPPGGVLEIDETPEQGVTREVFEETGIKVEVQNLAGVYKNMTQGVIALVFLCRPVSGVETASDETSRVAWWTLQEVDSQMTNAYAIRVRDAFSTKVNVRSHDGTDLI